MKCLNPITVNERQFNCGHCRNCRVNYTQEWALRITYELSKCDSASFITLTYSDEFRPGELRKKDLQDFFKRLRINMQREYHEFAPKIRYYACGEYGSRTKREHFHAIVFGLDNYNDKHRDILKASWPFCESWMFDKERGRQSGMQEVTPDDIAYVTGYVQKKLNGEMAKEEYGEKQPPFSCCSQALGLDFALKNKERLISNGYTFYKGHKIGIPRYFCEKFGVKKGELLTNVSLQPEKEYTRVNKELLEQFKADMERKKCFYPQNTALMTHLFDIWYDNKRFAYADAIYSDFRQRQALRNGL